ncbi:MAG TPA: phenylalanine--tRNA ligase subunit beta [Gammaproteobacteria bacterium]|nr:phenylalanine--tRNA ligase subunit beta [Gammaproteobacteria bacterium]
MKLSEQWLREWCNPPIGVEDIVRTLNSLGLEVGSVEPVAPPFSGVVIAQIKAVQAHPDADRLRICRVSNGKSELQIVSGAPNVYEGMKVPLALVGANLPNGIEIKQSKLRGVESFGMLCSEAELGLVEKAEGLMELPQDAPVGNDIREYLKLDDKLIEVDLTPNRGDCLSVKGIARELALATGSSWQERWPASVAVAIKSEFPIAIKAPQDCPRYIGRVVEGINTSARSPLWLVEKLRRGGIRTIHPVVDITNYVMLEMGQPMHAFNLDALSGGIVVRRANPGEQIRLLDGNEAILDAETLVIADSNGVCALAGIMGGSGSAVNENSRRIFLESAFFAPTAIQGKARRYGLHTDSSHRFERGVAPDLQRHAIERATALILEIAGGKPGPIIEAAEKAALPRRKVILLRRERIRKVLGTRLEDKLIEKILTGLGSDIEVISEGWKVTPPAFRFDLNIEVDLIEELARIHGYERLPRTVPAYHPKKLASSESAVSIEALSDMLIQQGYHEVICYSFVDPKLQALLEPLRSACVLSNPISAEMAEMRTSLLPSLLTALKYNLNRQQKQLQIFEIGSKYLLQSTEIKEEMLIAGLRYGPQSQEHWDKKHGLADFYDIKGDVERLIAYTGLPVRFEPMIHSALHPGRTAAVYLDNNCIGWLGEVHPRIRQTLDLGEGTTIGVFELRLDFLLRKKVPSYHPISRYPSIRRDLALVVDQSVTWAQFEACLLSVAPSYLTEVRLFDVYTGKGVISGRKSFAIGLILQEISRTLTDTEIESAIGRILQTLNQNLGATLRE